MLNADCTLKTGPLTCDNIHLTQGGGYELCAHRTKPITGKLFNH